MYRINMAATPGFSVKSARLGGQEALRKGLNVAASNGGELEIALSNKPGQITGSVMKEDAALDGESLAGYMVTLWSESPEPGIVNGGVRTVYTDRNGGFTFRNLLPGEYFAAAWEEADPQLVLSRDFLSQFSGEGVSVTLTGDGTGSAQAKLISAEKSKAAEAKLP